MKIELISGIFITLAISSTLNAFTIHDIQPAPSPVKAVACDKSLTHCTGVGDDNGHQPACEPFQCQYVVAYYTDDAGNTWHKSNVFTSMFPECNDYINALACDETATKCVAVGKFQPTIHYTPKPRTYVTVNGGRTWRLSLAQPKLVFVDEDPRRTPESSLESVHCDSQGVHCEAKGYYGNHIESKLPVRYISADGGNTWTPPITQTMLNPQSVNPNFAR